MSSWNEQILLRRITNVQSYTENTPNTFSQQTWKLKPFYFKILPNPCQNVYYQEKSMAKLERWFQGLEHWLLFLMIRVWFSTPTGWLQTIYNSNLRGSDILFWPLWSQEMWCTNIHADKIPIHIKIRNRRKNDECCWWGCGKSWRYSLLVNCILDRHRRNQHGVFTQNKQWEHDVRRVTYWKIWGSEG